MQMIAKKYSIWIFAYPLFILYQLFLWPVLITNDGTTYLSSATALFSDDILLNYYWIREPLYPLFLKFISSFGLFSGIVLILLQSTFIYLSFLIAFIVSIRIFNIKINNSYQIIFVLSLFISLFFISYGAMVLQQAILALFIITLVYFVIFFNTKNSKKSLITGLILYALFSFITINFTFHYFYIHIFAAVLIAYGITNNALGKRSKFFKKFASILLISLILSMAQFVSSLPWNSFKNSTLQSSEEKKYTFSNLQLVSEIENLDNTEQDPKVESNVWSGTEFPSPFEFINAYNFWSPEPNYLERFLAFFSLYEPDVPTLWKENKFFLELLLQNRTEGSYLISAGWQPYLGNAESILPINNSGLNKMIDLSDNLINKILNFSNTLYQVIALGFLISSLYIFLFKRNKLFNLTFLLIAISIIPYLMTWSVDRYSIPLYPIMVAIILGFLYSRFPFFINFLQKELNFKSLNSLIVLTGLSVVLISIFNLSFFQNNDDVLIFSIADGSSYGFEDEFLIYPSIILGKLLTTLYDLYSSLNWYFVLLSATQAMSLLTILTSIKAKFKTRYDFFLLISLIFFSSIIFFSLQYTQTAIFTAGLGALLALTSEGSKTKYLAIFLMFIGSLWRFEAAILAIATVSIIYFVLNPKIFFIKRTLILPITFGIILITQIFAVRFLTPFNDQNNNSFLAFNSARESVQGFSPTRDTESILFQAAKEISWTRNDFDLSQKSSYAANSEIYNESSFSYISDARYGEDLYNFTLNLIDNYISIILENHLYLILFILFFMLLIIHVYSKLDILKLFTVYILLNIILLIILAMGKLPERILWPLLIVVLFTLFLSRLMANDRSEYLFFKKSFSKIIMPIFVILLIINVFNHLSIIRAEFWWKHAVENREKGFDRIISYTPDKPIVSFSSFYSPLFKLSNPLLGPTQQPNIREKLIIIGWPNQSPSYINNLTNLGISEDLFMSIAEGEAYLAIGKIEDLQMVDQYLQENKGIKVNWPVAPFVFSDTGLGIWKVDSYQLLTTEMLE